MRSVALCVVALCALSPGAARGQLAPDESPEARESPTGFAGTYLFEWQDGRSVVEVEMEGSLLRARVTMTGGYSFGLVGAAEGDLASGTIVGKSGTGDFGEFTAALEEPLLHLDLTLRPAPDQEPQQLSITFSRTGDAFEDLAPVEGAPAAPTPPAAGAAPFPGPAPDGAAGDPRLVGTWVYQSLVTSGDASFASEQIFELRADGSYAFGTGSTAGGGAGWSYDGGSGDSEVERGHWRAAEGILYLFDASGQWRRIGKYGMTEDGSTMRITYDSGGRKLWSRR